MVIPFSNSIYDYPQDEYVISEYKDKSKNMVVTGPRN
jgi:hypothetical protein